MRLANAILSTLFFFSIAMLPLRAAEEGIESMKKKKEVSKQISFNAKAIDANRVACFIYNDGTFGVNPETGGDGCYFPAGQEDLSVLYSAGLWILGKVQVDTLRMLYSCVSFYRSEFQPGIMLTDSTADSPGEAKYKVYKYAAGDTVEQDAVSQGCPGEVLGDQMLFSVYNDWRNEDYIWNTLAIGLEVQQTSFAWDEAFGLGHTIFSRYRIYNKGKDTLDTAYVAIWLDPDIGWANDDYAGCDTALDMIFAYNGDDFDEKYGTIIPAAGCDLLQGPIVDAPGETVILPDGTELTDKAVLGMTASFILCGNSSIPGMRGPQNATEAYAFMQGMQGNGEPWLDPAQGNSPTPFPFAGDPVLGTGWLLEDALSGPNDIHMGIAAGPFTMAPGDSQDVVIALVVGRGTNRLNSITVLKNYDLDAQLAYQSDFDVVASSEKFAYVPEKTSLSQNYPNPFNPSTTISFSLSKPGFVTLNVYNILGRRVATLVEEKRSAGPHDIEWLPENISSGIYFYQLTVGETVLTRKLLYQK